jgi:23S rRNA (guanosine2251-2'-O)-methyltransferase
MSKKDQLIFGVHAVREALLAGKELERVLVRRDAGSDVLKQLAGDLRERGIPLQQVPLEKLNRTTGKNHQGVIAWLSRITYSDITSVLPAVFETGEDPLILLLDGISDVRNFGAIARSAECAGVHGIVIPASGSAAINPEAIKTSAGALHRIPVCRSGDLLRTVRYLRDSGLRIIAASEKGEEAVFRSDMTGPVGIILGSEGRGVSGVLLKAADNRVSIPMMGEISSLNVSVAAGILLFEVVRQRNLQV